MTPLEVPERDVEHGSLADDEGESYDLSQGQMTTLDMSNQAKAKARRKREKLERELGGFGFRGAA